VEVPVLPDAGVEVGLFGEAEPVTGFELQALSSVLQHKASNRKRMIGFFSFIASPGEGGQDEALQDKRSPARTACFAYSITYLAEKHAAESFMAVAEI
jgi:hypothetical protein